MNPNVSDKLNSINDVLKNYSCILRYNSISLLRNKFPYKKFITAKENIPIQKIITDNTTKNI